MKRKVVLFILPCLFLLRCATYYHLLGEDKSDFYSGKEVEILDKTVKSVEFGYGYEVDLDLDYLFPLYQGFNEFKPDGKELEKAIDGMDAATLISYSEKIYWLKRTAEYKLKNCEKIGDWRNYTFIEKYLLPPIGYFSGLLEKQALKKDKNYSEMIDKRKKAIDRKVLWIMRRKDFEELWKYDYNS